MRFCPICRGEVDPADPSVVLAIKSPVKHGGRPTVPAGGGDYLHKRCFHDSATNYRLEPKPRKNG